MSSGDLRGILSLLAPPDRGIGVLERPDRARNRIDVESQTCGQKRLAMPRPVLLRRILSRADPGHKRPVRTLELEPVGPTLRCTKQRVVAYEGVLVVYAHHDLSVA